MIKTPVAARRLALGTIVAAATLAIAIAPTVAASAAVYKNIPSVFPGNVSSVGYEATSTSEFGDFIELAAGERSSGNLPVTVVMSVWACETGGNATCATTEGATWNQALTLSIYNVDESGSVPAAGSLVLRTAQTFALPYRPSYDASGPCAARGSTGWYSAAEDRCFNGYAHPVTFALPAGVTLPDRLIWGIAFNTSHHGYAPTGVGGPWDSLNLAVTTFSGQPAVGTDVEPGSAFMNSTWSGAYNDNGAAGTGSFRDDVGGWTGYAPLACFGTCPINVPVPTASPTVSATATIVTDPPASATPFESFEGASAAPIDSAGPDASASPTEIVEGATATTGQVTPPPTSSGGSSEGGSSGLLVLLISIAFGSIGIVAVGAQRRKLQA